MPFYERDELRIHYEESGNPGGFPLLLFAGGGLNSAIQNWGPESGRFASEFDPRIVLASDFRLIAMDQRNATSGESIGPVPVDEPWNAYLSDQLGLMDYLDVKAFAVLGFCIGCSFALGLMEKAPDRVSAGVLCQPIGHRDEDPDVMVNASMNWGRSYIESHPEMELARVERMVDNMYRSPSDFVYSVSRDFVRSLQTPILVLPGIDRAHPHDVGIEVAELAPNSELVDPWKEPEELIPQTVDRIRGFLLRNTPAITK